MSMDVGMSASGKINGDHGLCMNTFEEDMREVVNDLSADELSDDVSKFLHIHDDVECDSTSSTCHDTCEFKQDDLGDKFLLSETAIQEPELCLHKHASLPSSGKTLIAQDGSTSELSTHGDNGFKSHDPSSFRSVSLPARLKPISALKGSREKRGVAPPVKLTVKWAPEVYDPVPTSVSHVVTSSRSSSKHSKKNSKYKQKHGSKSSRGSKSKDKKQVRKRGGNSSSGMSYKFEHEEQLVDFSEQEPQSGDYDFHVGNSDRLCGGSFINRYGTGLHLSSVAEAT